MQIVKCLSCGWIGKQEDLGLYYNIDTEYCPRCKETEMLMDRDRECEFDSDEIEKLWEILGDVPIDDDGRILEAFLGFPERTDRTEIWKWFDERYQDGVVKLMNGGAE